MVLPDLQPVRYPQNAPNPLSLRWQHMYGPVPKYAAYLTTGAVVGYCLFSYLGLGAKARLESDYRQWKTKNHLD